MKKIANNIILRNYETGDYARFLDFWIRTDLGKPERGDSEELILKTIQSGGFFLILENTATNEIIGTSWVTNDQRRLYLHHFGIKPEYQNQGFGKILTQESLKIAKQIGLQIKLEVHKDNKKAIALYKKNRFASLGDYMVYIIRNY